MPEGNLLVVAGEQSGDAAAAAVLDRLEPAQRAHAFGMGGAALAAAGLELVSDLRRSTAMGFGSVARRGAQVVSAFGHLVQAIGKRKPTAALLVNYTEFNLRLAARLHRAGTRVLWYGAPQIWAWREGRAESLRPYVDRLAVILPFEEALWRGHGVDARYVGHPAQEAQRLSRAEAREALGLTERAFAVGILPGSRAHEVERLLAPMLEAYDRIRRDRASVDARVLVAASLEGSTRARVFEAAERARVTCHAVDPRRGASEHLAAFDATLCASGTASLEAALARSIPIVGYRVDLLSEIIARHTLTTPAIALPNILLGRHAFVELTQGSASARCMADALADAVGRRADLLRACDEVEAALGPSLSPSRTVASWLQGWLS
jgi:lipid-A-disaccharide synthase